MLRQNQTLISSSKTGHVQCHVHLSEALQEVVSSQPLERDQPDGLKAPQALLRPQVTICTDFLLVTRSPATGSTQYSSPDLTGVWATCTCVSYGCQILLCLIGAGCSAQLVRTWPHPSGHITLLGSRPCMQRGLIKLKSDTNLTPWNLNTRSTCGAASLQDEPCR